MVRNTLPLLTFIATVGIAGTSYAQQYVDGTGNCGGNTPCNLTIQAAVNAATPGSTVTVYPGTYSELITINKALTLTSTDGASATTIQWPLTGNYQAPVMIPSPTSNVTIGGQTGKGFTVIGIDNTPDSAGAVSESAAILIGAGLAPMTNINISYNILTANGEAALLTYSKSTGPSYLSNLTIARNIFNGQTFTGTAPASGSMFSNYNTAKPAVTVNPGASSTIFSYNTISPTTGAGGLGNDNVLITSAGSTLEENIFDGTVSGVSAALLNLRGSGSAMQCNTFNFSNSTSAVYVITSTPTPPYVTTAVAADNTFQPSTIYYSAPSFYNFPAGTPANYLFPAPGCTIPLALEYIKLNASMDASHRLTANWSVNEDEKGEIYEVQTSCGSSEFSTTGELAAKGGSTKSYTLTTEPKDYCNPMLVRIKHISNTGKVLYSNIARLQTGAQNSEVFIYPNPVKEYIGAQTNLANATLVLYDYTGRKVKEQAISSGDNKVDVQAIPNGMYLIKIIAEGDAVIYSGKIVK
jgi:hypothetical protein